MKNLKEIKMKIEAEYHEIMVESREDDMYRLENYEVGYLDDNHVYVITYRPTIYLVDVYNADGKVLYSDEYDGDIERYFPESIITEMKSRGIQ
jgi:hypothetical protein